MSSAKRQASKAMHKPLIFRLFSGLDGHQPAWNPEFPRVSQSDCQFLQLLPRADRSGRASNFSILVDPWDGQHKGAAELPSELVPRGVY